MEKKTKTVSKVLKATKRQVIEFQYIVQRQEKAKVCFGSGTQRQNSKDASRHSSTYTLECLEQLTPGMYSVPCDLIDHRPASKKGTVLAGRTANLQPCILEEQSPGPAFYKIQACVEREKPTLSRCPRFKPLPKSISAGPGYYKPSTKQKTLAYHESFGGKRYLVPAIEMKCGPTNTDICEICKSSPVGDYWQFQPMVTYQKQNKKTDDPIVYLCRNCYNQEKKESTKFSRKQLENFKKIRDCSQVHFHDGCEARILLVPPRDIDKMREKEAYLSLYFS